MRAHGFTVIEMIITVTIAAVLVALALPNLSEFLKNNARATNLNTVVAAMNFARSHAVGRTTNVAVCQSDNQATCTGGGAFGDGFIVFTDADGAVCDLDGADVLLRVFTPRLSDDALIGGLRRNGGFITCVRFRPTGMPDQGLQLVSNPPFFAYCDDRGDRSARAIAISAGGGARLSLDADDSGVHDAPDGTDLVCP